MLDITREASGYACQFGYDAALVAALKAATPSRHRRWDPARRAWLIAAQSWPLAERVFVEFGLLEGVTTAADSSPWRTLHLQPTAPPELVTAAYRALAKTHHPDTGGTDEQMKRLNLAYEAVKGTRNDN